MKRPPIEAVVDELVRVAIVMGLVMLIIFGWHINSPVQGCAIGVGAGMLGRATRRR